MADFLKLAQEAFDASTSFIQSNHQADWDYALRAFRSEHAAGSKYLSDEYKLRSRLYRPKTRAIIRKNEAAGHAAFFSNMEIVDLQPGDPDNMMSLAARDCMKAILEYRLTKTIPTFQVFLGGLQDAQTVGTVCSYQYWEYEERDGVKIKDKPCIELRPIENIRIDCGASWVDPVGTSPYFCDVIPMYVCDVKAMMGRKDTKTGLPTWKTLDEKALTQAYPDTVDALRQARLGKGQDPHQERNAIKDFDVVWVLRWFMRDSQSVDHTYYTLGTEALLSDPKPIKEVYFHGVRPYVMGCAVIETHKTFKSGLPILTKQLQMEANDIANQRIDNVKFVLHKRWFVARGRQVDVQSLVRGAPGGVTLLTDPKTDVQESNWPDVTSSAYVEQDRINADMDELAGNFSPSTKVANNAVNDTLGGSRMASAGAGMMTDYLLRTVAETWWEPVLRQLVKLEQAYETDEKILALCAQKARLFPRYGLSQINDDLMNEEVHLTVNVGMGASNPNERLQKFIAATQMAIGIVNTAPPGFNVMESVKEIYSNAGYRDGARFFSDKQDPRLVKAMQTVQSLQQALEGKQMDIQAKGQIEKMKVDSDERMKMAQLRVDAARIDGDLKIRQAELALERLKILRESDEDVPAEIDAAAGRAIKEIQNLIAMHAVKVNGLLEVDRVKRDAKAEVQAAKTDASVQTDMAQRDTQMAEAHAERMEASNAQLMDGVNKIIAGLAALANQKKTVALIKKDGQTVGAEIGVA